MRRSNHVRLRRNGVTMIYMIIIFPVLVAFCALAVDVGRYQVAKEELQSVADSAARYAARGMLSSSTPMTTARANANAVVAESVVDGGTPTLASADIQQGMYDAASKTFTPDSAGTSIKVTVRQSLNRAGAVPLLISMLVGTQQTQLAAVAIAHAQTTTTSIQPPASGNLWLSGMPDNTQTQNNRPDANWVWDNNGTTGSPKQRPLQVNLSDLSVTTGDTISLEGLTGSATYNTSTPDSTTNTADGDVTYLVSNGTAPAGSAPTNSLNGMSNTRAPIGAVMAVFLSDDSPDLTSAPTDLDFGTSAQRDYTSISPQLKQVFYIGDGKRSTGEMQTIVIPPGATRVYFGMMDAWQWNDNVGNFKANLYTRTSTQLQK